MSSTVSPSDGGNAHVKKESPQLEDERILRIKTSEEADNDLNLVFVPLFGAPPPDSPVWQGMTHRKMDFRALGAYTVRYKCRRALSSRDYAAVRQAIFRRLQQLLADNQVSALAGIAFDEAVTDANGDRPGIIDLVFDSFNSLVDVVHGLDRIEVEGRHGIQHSFSHAAFTLSLGGSILPLDCHNLPVDALDNEALFNAFQAALQPAGSLLGFGKLTTWSRRLDIKRQGTGVARLYLQLHEENISTPWNRFVDLLPTHLKINGVVHSLHYCGRHLHTEDVISPNFTVAKIDETEAQAAKKRRAAPSDGSTSGSTAAKRRCSCH